jgi:hypothetical protein
MDLASELRSASDMLLDRLDLLRELEAKKRRMSPGTPGFAKLAAEIQGLAAQLLDASERQSEIADATVQVVAGGAGQVALTPIEEIPPLRDVQTVLAEWREAERRLGPAVAGSTEAEAAQADVTRLRAEYRRSLGEALKRANGGQETR